MLNIHLFIILANSKVPKFKYIIIYRHFEYVQTHISVKNDLINDLRLITIS